MSETFAGYVARFLGPLHVVATDCGTDEGTRLHELRCEEPDLVWISEELRREGRQAVAGGGGWRSAALCEAEGGVCVACWGDGSLGRATVGDDLGARIAEATADPGEGRYGAIHHPREPADQPIRATASGVLRVEARTTTAAERAREGRWHIGRSVGPAVAVAEDGRWVVERDGREVARGLLPAGAALRLPDGSRVEEGEVVACVEPRFGDFRETRTWAAGVVRFEGLEVAHPAGQAVVTTRRARWSVMADGQVVDEGSLPYGDRPLVADGDALVVGQLLSASTPGSLPILSPVAGKLTWVDVPGDGIVAERPGARPRLTVAPQEGTVSQIFLPVAARVLVADGSSVEAGQRLADIPHVAVRYVDLEWLPGGRTRVERLLGLAEPALAAPMALFAGHVVEVSASQVTVRSDDAHQVERYTLPAGSEPQLTEGDYVRAGELIGAGEARPLDVVHVQGYDAAVRWLADELYRTWWAQRVAVDLRALEVLAATALAAFRPAVDSREVDDELPPEA